VAKCHYPFGKFVVDRLSTIKPQAVAKTSKAGEHKVSPLRNLVQNQAGVASSNHTMLLDG
jgi:hypothetical protein